MAESMADARDTGTGTATGDDSVAAAHPAAVKGGATISVTVVLLAVLVASVAAFLMSSPPHAGDKRMEGAGKPTEPVEHAVSDDVGIPGFNSRLDAFRAWTKLTWMKLRRPRSDDHRYNDGAASAAGSVTEAAKKSFEMGKETVEQAAATAGKATGEAVGMAKEKVKGAASPPRPASTDDAEL